jgi:hypothetical protein
MLSGPRTSSIQAIPKAILSLRAAHRRESKNREGMMEESDQGPQDVSLPPFLSCLWAAQRFRQPFQADARPPDNIVGTKRSPIVQEHTREIRYHHSSLDQPLYRLMGIIGILFPLSLTKLFVLTFSTSACLTETPSVDWAVR